MWYNNAVFLSILGSGYTTFDAKFCEDAAMLFPGFIGTYQLKIITLNNLSEIFNLYINFTKRPILGQCHCARWLRITQV